MDELLAGGFARISLLSFDFPRIFVQPARIIVQPFRSQAPGSRTPEAASSRSPTRPQIRVVPTPERACVDHLKQRTSGLAMEARSVAADPILDLFAVLMGEFTAMVQYMERLS